MMASEDPAAIPKVSRCPDEETSFIRRVVAAPKSSAQQHAQQRKKRLALVAVSMVTLFAVSAVCTFVVFPAISNTEDTTATVTTQAMASDVEPRLADGSFSGSRDPMVGHEEPEGPPPPPPPPGPPGSPSKPKNGPSQPGKPPKKKPSTAMNMEAEEDASGSWSWNADTSQWTWITWDPTDEAGAWSYDGYNWVWVMQKPTEAPRGENGSWDWMGDHWNWYSVTVTVETDAPIVTGYWSSSTDTSSYYSKSSSGSYSPDNSRSSSGSYWNPESTTGSPDSWYWNGSEWVWGTESPTEAPTGAPGSWEWNGNEWIWVTNEDSGSTGYWPGSSNADSESSFSSKSSSGSYWNPEPTTEAPGSWEWNGNEWIWVTNEDSGSTGYWSGSSNADSYWDSNTGSSFHGSRMTQEDFRAKMTQHFDEMHGDSNFEMKKEQLKSETFFNALLDQCIIQASEQFGHYDDHDSSDNFASAVDWVSNECLVK